MTVRVTAAGIKKYTARRHKKRPPFIKGKGYAVHGFDHDEEGNGYVRLVNEYRELFWISNRVVRVVTQ